MRLPLPEPIRDPAVFQPMFEKGMRDYPERKANHALAATTARGETAAAMPTMMDIEPASRCNYACGMCILHTWKNRKRADDMTFEMFRRLLDQQPGLWEVKLQGLGEPLLNRDLADMVALCSERSIWTRTTINGSLLHMHDNARRLLEAGIGEVQVSLDGADKETYEAIRRGGDFDRFAENCRLFNRLAASYRSTSATRAFVLVQRANFHQLDEILSFCAGVGFQRVIFSMQLGWFGVEELREPNLGRDVSSEVSYNRCLELVEAGKTRGLDVTFWQGGNKYRVGDPSLLCAWLWERAFIGSDGRIVPCCAICDPRVMDMGDAERFAETWNGDRYRALRKAHLAGAIPTVCRGCYEGMRDTVGATGDV